MRTAVRLLVAIAALGLLFLGPRAEAACHFFTVSALSQVSEGGKVEVTVERDADVNESSVLVTTVNGTAKAPADFTAVSQRVSWPAQGGTEKKITISTREDATPEPSETFSVKVSKGDGCNPPNPNYEYGPPAKITIKDDDAATPKPSTPTPQTPAPQAAPLTTSTPSPTPSPTPTATPKETDEPTPSPTATALAVSTEDDDDGFPWLPVGAVVGFLAAAGGALMLTRMRRGV